MDPEIQKALVEFHARLGMIESLVNRQNNQLAILEQQMLKAWQVIEFLIEQLGAKKIIEVTEMVEAEYKEIERD